MIKLSLKFTLIVCFFGIHAFSQNQTVQPGDPNDLDQQFVPDKNSILNSVNSSKSSTGNYISSPVKNAVKFNLTLLSRSTAAVFWEHPFGKVVSAEVGLGFTYGQDYMQKVFSEVTDAFNSNNTSSHVRLSDLLTNTTNAGGLSPFLSGGVKFYFSDDAPEGSYFNLNVRYATNNLTYTPNDNSAIVIGSPDVTIKNLGFNFLYGYQVVSGIGKASFVQDVYIGMGIRKTSYTNLVMSSTTNSQGNYQTVYAANGTSTITIQPIFVIGYCLGIGF